MNSSSSPPHHAFFLCAFSAPLRLRVISFFGSASVCPERAANEGAPILGRRSPFAPILAFALALALLATLGGMLRLAAAPAAPAATLVALVYDPVTATESVAYVDATTGTVTPFGDGLANCCRQSSLDAVFDQVGNRLLSVMIPLGESAPHVVTFDVASGAAALGPALATTATVNYLAYDAATARLLGLFFDANANRQQLATIEPATGAVSFIGSGIEQCCTIGTAFDAALDMASRRLYAVMRPFTGTEAVLYTVDIDSGMILAGQPLSNTAGVNFLRFDAAGGQLLAIANDPQSDAERLAAVDPVSGTVTFTGDGASSCCNLLITDAALDTAANRLAVAMLDRDATARLYSYDLATGELLHQPVLPGSYIFHFAAYLPAPSHAIYLPAIEQAPAPDRGHNAGQTY